MLLHKLPRTSADKIFEENIKKEFRNFIIEQDHPCVMAKSVFLNERCTLKDYGKFGTVTAAVNLMSDLRKYLKSYSFSDDQFESFVACFSEQEIKNEFHFEELMWRQLRLLKQCDNHPWDPTVSSDPTDDNFSFSLAGKAFYIVGMHPKASRDARRTPHPCLVFNLHWQFERLRRLDVYDEVKNRIRARDKEKNGSVNPVLEDFGSNSEARQYSGRDVGENWKCPYSRLD